MCFLVVILSLVFALIVTAKTDSYDVPGDVNGDTVIDICDVMLALRYITNPEIRINELSADVNADGAVNVLDLARILQYIAGWDVTLLQYGNEMFNTERLADWSYTLSEEDHTIILNKYTGTSPNVYVPAVFTVEDTTYNTVIMVDRSKQSSAFTGSQIITSVFFADGVSATEMSYMFRGCPNLRYINKYPEYNGIWWIGVFYNCKKLVSAPPIPDNIDNIRITAFFSNCLNLIGDYSMPDSYNTNYASNVFHNCSNINKGRNIIWLGDSITAGTSTNGVSFVDYLIEDLKDTGIANVAVGGRTLSYGHDLNEDAIIASIVHDLESFGVLEHVDHVFVSAGTNDFAHRSLRRPFGTYRFADMGNVTDLSPHTVSGAVNTIIREAHEKFPNATLVFTTPITRFNYDVEGAKATDTSLYTVHLKEYVDCIKATCDAAGVPYFDAYTESGFQVLEDSCDGTQYYFSDKTHLTLAGQRKMADYLLEKLVQLYGFQKKDQ